MKKAANGRSSIYRDETGWHGWVSFGATPDGRRRRKHVRGQTKREVAEKVGRLERQRDAGFLGERSVTVAEWLATWIEARELSGVRRRTLEGYRLDERHINKAIGAVRLDRLTAEQIDRLWSAILAGGAGPATCAHVRRTLSAALTAAVARGHLARNPVKLSHAPRYDPAEVEPLTEADARRILEAAVGRPNAARWSVALALGLRQGEALGIRWQDIDLDRGIISVRVQLQHLPWRHGCVPPGPAAPPSCGRDPGRCPQRAGGGPTLVPVKSKAGRRVVGLPEALAAQLAAHRANCESRPGSVISDAPALDLVFTRPDGAPIRKETDSAEWHRILGVADVRPARLHDARHTAATLLLVQGVPAGVAMRLLGHADTRVLARYQHVVDEATRAAADRVGSVLWVSPKGEKPATIGHTP